MTFQLFFTVLGIEEYLSHASPAPLGLGIALARVQILPCGLVFYTGPKSKGRQASVLMLTPVFFCPPTPGGATAPGRALQIQQAESLLWLTHQPPVASIQAALTARPPQTWCLGPRPQSSQSKAWTATCPIKRIPDATMPVSRESRWGVGVRSGTRVIIHSDHHHQAE